MGLKEIVQVLKGGKGSGRKGHVTSRPTEPGMIDVPSAGYQVQAPNQSKPAKEESDEEDDEKNLKDKQRSERNQLKKTQASRRKKKTQARKDADRNTTDANT